MAVHQGPSDHLFRRATDLTGRQPEEWDTTLSVPEYVLLAQRDTPTVEAVQGWAVKAWLDDVRDHGGEPLSAPTLRVWEDPVRGGWQVQASGIVKATVRVSHLSAEVADLKATTARAVEDAERWAVQAKDANERAHASEKSAKDWELRCLEAEGINERIANERMLRLRSWMTTSAVALLLAQALIAAVAVFVVVLLVR